MINFDAVDFSERRPEEVISFFWRSVYIHLSRAGGGGGGAPPLQAVPDAREKKTRKKGIQIRRGGRGTRETRKRCQKRDIFLIKCIQKLWSEFLAKRSNVERVGNLRQHVYINSDFR